MKNKLFWLIDTLKGSPLKKDILEITDCLSVDRFSTLKKKSHPKLDLLLKTAVSNSEFYHKYSNYKTLDDFPVLNKSLIKDNEEQFIITKEDLKDLNKVSTSGSTGIPFTVYQTKRKKIRNTADTLYFGNAAGYIIGHQLLYLRLWSAYYKKNKIIAKLQNIKQLDVSDLKNETYIKGLIDGLQKDNSPKGWIGYASGFESICNYLDKINSSKLKCNVKSIIAISESLNPIVKSKMEYYFNAPTLSRYSNVENGIIAQQSPNDNCFKINWASYIVEILDLEHDLPVEDGKIGRIVITDLYNLAMPLIRYDTGDLGAFAEKQDLDEVPKLKSIQGRKADVLLTTTGEYINPFTFFSHALLFPKLEQVQYIQTSKQEYTIKINNSKKQFKREKELLMIFKETAGNDALVKIEYVNEIPSINSGKRRLCINLYTKQ